MRLKIVIILFILGTTSVGFAWIMQCFICVQMYGVVFKQVFIPHWSSWFYLGIIPTFIGCFLVKE